MAKHSNLPTKAEQKLWREEALDRATKGLAPDFSLSPLVKFPNATLMPDLADSEERKALKRLTLTLGLVFNDLKDLSWARGILEYWPPEDQSAIEPYAGQWNGMRTFFVRHLCGVLSELGEVIDAKRSLLESPALAAARAKLNKVRPAALKAWEAMLGEFARKPEPSASVAADAPQASGSPQSRKPRPRLVSNVARCVSFVRHKTAYHYGHAGSEDRLLSDAFGRHCGANLDDRHRFAFASLGANMEQSRFYFADAAVGRLAQDGLDDEKVSLDEMYQFVKSINFALRFMVEALLRLLGESGSK